MWRTEIWQTGIWQIGVWQKVHIEMVYNLFHSRLQHLPNLFLIAKLKLIEESVSGNLKKIFLTFQVNKTYFGGSTWGDHKSRNKMNDIQAV